MGWDVNVWRRGVGVFVLMAALAMLVAGETVLKDRLKDLQFLGYWFLCFCFTAMAFLVAILDARALRRRARQQRRALLTSTFDDIQAKARSRSPRRDQDSHR